MSDTAPPLNSGCVQGKHDHAVDMCQDCAVPKEEEYPWFIPCCLHPREFLRAETWRASIVECIAMAVFVFGSITSIFVGIEQSTGSPLAAISILHFFMIAFLIMAAGPAGGGHLNPCITTLIMLVGRATPAQAILLIIGQFIGSVLGSLSIKAIAPDLAHKHLLGGCIINTPMQGPHNALTWTGLDKGPAFVSEFCFTFALLFIATFVALDERQFRAFGPLLVPIMISGAVAMLIFMTSGLVPGYTGAGMNPARCFGPAAIMGGHLWYGHWIFWVAPCLATALVGLVYKLTPPYHVEVYNARQDLFSNVSNRLKKRKARLHRLHGCALSSSSTPCS